jgi:hypothetical protein
VKRRDVPLSVGMGWSLIVPFDRPLDATLPLWSALWLGATLAPVGYWGALTRDARRSGRQERGPGMGTIVALIAVILAAGLIAVPVAFGFQATPPAEWAGSLGGVAAGFIAGGALRARRDRWRHQ